MAICQNGAFLSPSFMVRGGCGLLVSALLILLQACAPRQEPPPPAPAPVVEPALPAPPAAEVPPVEGRFFADAQEYPWSALGRVNLAGRGFCNAIMIGAQQALTQAQCLYTVREGRWWQPSEIHFIAAYQRDVFLANSKIAGFTIAPGYNPAAGASLANLTNNWAILQLAEPVGLQTGWLGLQRNDDALRADEARGQAVLLRAGYRTDWPNAISVYIGCAQAAVGSADVCAATPSERALPPFVITRGEMRIVTDHFFRSAEQESAMARAAALSASGARFGALAKPQANSKVRRTPSVSSAMLLQALGYSTAAQDPEAATRQFITDQSLSVAAGRDLSLLAALIASAQRGPRR